MLTRGCDQAAFRSPVAAGCRRLGHTARCRGHLARRLKTLKHDLELLVLRPPTPSAGLDDLKALNL
jgi:hypothetical protein